MMQRIILYILVTITIGFNSSAQEVQDPIQRIYSLMRLDSLSNVITETPPQELNDIVRLYEDYDKLLLDIYGPNCVDRLGVLSQLTPIYSKLRDYANASRCGEALVTLIKQHYGINTIDYAIWSDNLAKYNNELGLYDKGYKYSNEALSIIKKIKGENNIDYAYALTNYSISLSGLGQINEAIKNQLISNNIIKNCIGTSTLEYAIGLDNLSTFHQHKSDNERAIMVKLEAFNILDNLYPYSDDWLICANNLANCYYEQKEYEAALLFLNKIYMSKSDWRIGISQKELLESMIRCHYSLNQYEKLPSIYNDLIKLSIHDGDTKEKVISYQVGLLYAHALNKDTCHVNELSRIIEHDIFHVYKQQHDKQVMMLLDMADANILLQSENGLKYVEKAKNLCTKNGGNAKKIFNIWKSHFQEYYKNGYWKIATVCGNLLVNQFPIEKYPAFWSGNEGVRLIGQIANTSDYDCDYSNAVVFGKCWLDLAKNLDNDSSKVFIGEAFFRNATFNSHAGNYEEAIKLSKEALEIYKYIENPNRICSIYNNIGMYYGSIGNFELAIKYLDTGVQLNKQYFGNNCDKLAAPLGNMSVVYADMGNNIKALEYGEKAVKLLEQAELINTSTYTTALSSLATIYFELGNLELAKKSLFKALEIQREYVGDQHPTTLTTHSNIALLFHYHGDDKTAANTYAYVLSNINETLGENHPVYINALNGLAISLYNIDDNDLKIKAIPLLELALNYAKSSPNKNYSTIITCLTNLGTLYADLQKYSNTIEYYREAMDLQLKLSGKNHLNYINLQGGLANCYFEQGQYNIAVKLLSEYLSQKSDVIRSTFSNITSTERHLLWSKEDVGIFQTLIPQINLKYKSRCQNMDSLTYNSILFSKGILLNSEIEFSKLIAESGDEEVMSLYSEIQSNRRLLNKLYEKLINERSVNTDSLENECNYLERELIKKSKIYGDFTHNMNIDWKQVQSKLKDDDIAIEFVSFPTDNDSIMYCALTLKHGYESPRMIELFEAEQLNNIDKEDYYKTPILSKLVWGPLKEELDGVKNVYFAPAGELYNIAIESLRDFDGEGYVFDNWNLYRLSSTRELAIVKEKSNTDNVALYGGLIYDPDNVTFEKDTTTQNYYYAHTRSLPDSIRLRAGYDYLRGTLIEVEKIDSLYANKHTPTTLFTDVVGTETSLKKLSGNKLSNLHISTHGFYWSETDVKTNKDLLKLRFIDQDEKPRYVEDKAMTRSGLLFAGANAILQGDSIPDECDDGILTAQEISTLDFRGLDLLVLSACQTGLGEIKGDGVFGLQRGFKKAGVQSIVMSLWKVDDDATQKLMTAFYKNLLEGKSKRESFLNAQKVVRETPGFEDPEYWAGFILLDALN